MDLKSEKAQSYLMFRYQVLIEYVGTNYRGWQIQTKGKTIQGLIQDRISKLLKENEKIELSSSLIQPVNEIKSIGEFKVILNLHSEIDCHIKIKVIPEELIK